MKNDTYQLSKYKRNLKITKILKLRNKSKKKKSNSIVQFLLLNFFSNQYKNFRIIELS